MNKIENLCNRLRESAEALGHTIDDCYLEACVANLIRAAITLTEHSADGNIGRLAEATCFTHMHHNNMVKYAGDLDGQDRTETLAMLDVYHGLRYTTHDNLPGSADDPMRKR